jgi:hypothetical protein
MQKQGPQKRVSRAAPVRSRLTDEIFTMQNLHSVELGPKGTTGTIIMATANCTSLSECRQSATRDIHGVPSIGKPSEIIYSRMRIYGTEDRRRCKCIMQGTARFRQRAHVARNGRKCMGVERVGGVGKSFRKYWCIQETQFRLVASATVALRACNRSVTGRI